MRKGYPSDITREQFGIVEHHLKESGKRTRPQKHDLYDILCAILYLVKEGVSWRAIPHDFPDYNIVYYHFAKWSKKDANGVSTLDKVLADIIVMERLSNDKEAKPTVAIVDSKSIPNSSSAGVKGYDAGKKTSGVKIHIGVDTLGLPHAIKVTPANTQDRAGAIELFSTFRSSLQRVLRLFCDNGYTGKNFASAIGELLGAVVEVVKRNELHKFVVLPKRWIVERTFSWLDKYRRFWRNSERFAVTVEQLATLAFIRLILKRY